MSSLFFLCFFVSLFTSIHSQISFPKGHLLNCGAATNAEINGQIWVPDSSNISAGAPHLLTIPGILPMLATIRSFPLDASRKFCYVLPVYRWARYLLRTTYYYGGFDGGDSPAVFDQIVDGTVWSRVNTTEDYQRGMLSFYEGVFMARGKTMSVCLAKNEDTKSQMFISALEVLLLGGSVYNSTDFGSHALSLVARNNFGSLDLRFPDDPFDRYWVSSTATTGRDQSISNNLMNTNDEISVSGIWNLPPAKVFYSALTTPSLQPIELNWPPMPLPDSSYYIALYFADPSSTGSRIFTITINDIPFYSNLNPSPPGTMVFAKLWPLSGLTKLRLDPARGSDSGPLINAGEVFRVLALGGVTLTRDVIALVSLKNSLENPPLDWNGDPCLPSAYSWTGVTCAQGSHARVVSLNLTGMGLSGTISLSIARLASLTDLLIGNNNLSGPIPDLSPLKRLQRLHLQDNQLTGEIPPTLGDIGSLSELFLQNNDLAGVVPMSLFRPGLNLQIFGNQFLMLPPPPET